VLFVAWHAVRNRYLGACFSGIVVNPASIGHTTSLDSPQNGHVTPCGTSFVLLCGPETLNVFWHFVQVTIFSILNSLLLLSPTGLSGLPGGGHADVLLFSLPTVPEPPSEHFLSATPRLRPLLLLSPRFDRGVGSIVRRIFRQPGHSFLTGFANQQFPPGEAF
jgi:hypothetical protein